MLLNTRVVRDNTGNWFDPVCQSFILDQTDNIYVTSIEFSLQVNQVQYLLLVKLEQ